MWVQRLEVEPSMGSGGVEVSVPRPDQKSHPTRSGSDSTIFLTVELPALILAGGLEGRREGGST